MRYRIKDYTITGTTSIQVNKVLTKEDVRLIVNETQKVVIGSSMKKDKFDVYSANGISTITFDGSLCQLQPTDQLTIEIDNGDTLTQVQRKVEEESATIQAKIDNIDLSSVAKQGDNQEATNTAIYNAVKSLPDLSLLYAARAEKNDDGVNTYSIVLPVTAKVTYDDNGVATIQL